MKAKRIILPFLLAALLPLAASADWVLSGTSGNVTMTDGTHTLNMTVKSAPDRTLMLGRTGNTKSNALPGNSQTYSGSFDFTQRIVDGEGNEWTIVEVAPYAFYNNKAVSGTISLTSVTNIGNAAFGYATGFTGFTLGNKLETVGASAFNSTFGNLSFTPSLPPSVKTVQTGAFAHHTKWDLTTPMKLSGEIELRGVETLQSAAFYMDVDITKVVIGPKLTSFGVRGSGIDSMDNSKGVFERCDKLHTVEWYGLAPTSGFVKNTFWTNVGSACVTNYVYVDYLDGWTNAIKACGLGIGSLVSGNDPAGVDPADYDLSSPAVYQINPNDGNHKGKIFLSLLPGHPPVEGAPVFNSVPFVTKSNNQFVFHANMDEGEDCDLYAVFTDRAGNAVTNELATGVDGDPDTFYTCTPTGLTANKLYSFAVLGTKGSSEVTREGVGTFFNGEISVAAPAAFSENGGSGVFTFSRGAAADTGLPGGAVTVPFTLSGTAAEFDNFREMVRMVTIPEGAASATVPVEAVVNLASGDRTLSLVPDPAGLYLVGTTGTATITDWVPPAAGDFDSALVYKVAGYDANKSALANFPVLVRIPEGTVADATQMAFYDANGAFLPYEVDTWDATGESLVWVLMPTLAQNATLTLASGNAGWTAPDLAPALWRTAGYVAVLHLGEDGPSFAGSTVQGLSGTGVLGDGSDADVANQVAGAVGAARLVDDDSGGNQARIAVDDFEDYLDSLANMTISLWAKHSATRAPQNAERLFGNRSNVSDQATGLSAVTISGVSATTPVLDVRGNPTLGSANLDQYIKVEPGSGVETSWSDTWTHMSFSFNANPNPTWFHIGGARAAISNNKAGGTTQSTTFAGLLPVGTGDPFSFGNSYDSAGGSAIGFKGSLDEIRVKNGSVSDDWVFAEEATVSDAKFLVSGDDVVLTVSQTKVSATVGADAALPLQVQLLGGSASAPGSITVDWGDGTTTVTNLDVTAAGLAVSLAHAYAAAGNFTATATAALTGTDHSATVSVAVGVLPSELATGSGDTFTRYALLHTKGYAGTTALADFPVLVRISEASIDGFDYDECATGGADISFSLPDGTVLPHEIETWDPAGESLVWVKLPTLDGIATAFYLRWKDADPPANDPGAVWSRYVAVIHGGDAITNVVSGGVAASAGSASVAASASSGYVGGGVNKSVNKAIGLNLANPHASLTAANQYSVSAWFKRDGNGGKNNGTHILAGSISSWGASDGFLLIQEGGNYVSVATKSGHNWSSGTALANQVWGHVGFTYDGVAGALVAYFNGVEFQRKDNPGSMVNAGANYWTFGSYMNTASDDSFKGDMDEIRVLDGAATADWAKAEYDSMADGAFLGYGPAEEVDVSGDLVEATFAVDASSVTTNAATIVGTLVTASTNGLTSADVWLAFGKASEALPARTVYTNGWEESDSIVIPFANLDPATAYIASIVVSNANDAVRTYTVPFTTAEPPPPPADLRISEVGSAVANPWGDTTSFIEIHNNGGTAVDLEGYTIKRYQKGKFGKVDIVFPSYTLAAGAYAVVWCSDDFGYDAATVLVEDNVFRSGAYKCKASNTPRIHLYDAAGNELDTFQVLGGLADGQSMGPSADYDGVNLYYFSKKKITPGAANNYDGATALGAAFVSEAHSADEVALDADLTVTSTWEPLPGSTIAGVKMFYRLAFSNEVEVAMTDSGDGLAWTATIPASVYADALPGSLIRWRFVATDSADRTTKEPAFGSADGSPEYYGTITAPDFTSDLPVFHLFVAAPNVGTDLADDPTDDPRNLAAMDIDSDALTTKSDYADMTIGARASIYHNGHLYDNVTIDLRGNTSAAFQKKSHGLKFNKSDKLVYVNPYTGEQGEVRKTSFTSELADPSFLRQNVSFRFLDAAGVKVPFHYPVRLQRNGEFYQLGFHSIRFTDEIVDYYGWDEDCELVKNAGSLRTTSSTAGFETKIPEQDNEKNATANFRTLVANLTSADKSVLAWDILDVAKWINYMAATRITQEMDDVWGNLCVYLHNETGTWWPGAYDMNLSFGQYYREAGWTAQGLPGEVADADTLKSHPLYGGSQVRVYNKGTTSLFTGGGNVNVNYNGAFDAIYGDPLLRGMHLRRLRTLMDAYLKEPGTAQADTPIWQFFVSQTNAMYETACLDRAKWTDLNGKYGTDGNTPNIINPWGNKFYRDMIDGVNSVWDNYIVPRRTHLYVTHSAANETFIDTNTVFTVVEGGSVVCHNAGIPDAQPAGLKVRVSRRIVDADGTNTYVKVDNPNAIFLDVSGWTVSDGTTTTTLEPGTVIPPAGALYLVADRKAFTAAHPRAQVLLQGNVKAALVSSDATITVTDADGAVAATYAKPSAAPAGEAITEGADPFAADPTQPVIGKLSDGTFGSLSVEPGENEGDPSVLVIPFAAEAGFTYTLKTSASLLVPVEEWAGVQGVEPIVLSADGDAAFRVPMTGDAAFFVITAE